MAEDGASSEARSRRLAMEHAEAAESARLRERRRQAAEAAKKRAQQETRLKLAAGTAKILNSAITKSLKSLADCVARFGAEFEVVPVPTLIDADKFALGQDEALVALVAAGRKALDDADQALLVQVKRHLKLEKLTPLDGQENVVLAMTSLPLRTHADLRTWVDEEVDRLDEQRDRDALTSRVAFAERLVANAEEELGHLPDSISLMFQALVSATNASDVATGLARLIGEVRDTLDAHHKRVAETKAAIAQAKALLTRLSAIEVMDSDAAALCELLRTQIESGEMLDVSMRDLAEQAAKILRDHGKRAQQEERRLALQILQGCLEDLGYDISEDVSAATVGGESFFYRKRYDNGFATRVTHGNDNQLLFALGRVHEDGHAPSAAEQMYIDSENSSRDYKHCTDDVRKVINLAEVRGLHIGVLRQKDPGGGVVQTLSSNEIGEVLQQKIADDKRATVRTDERGATL